MVDFLQQTCSRVDHGGKISVHIPVFCSISIQATVKHANLFLFQQATRDRLWYMHRIFTSMIHPTAHKHLTSVIRVSWDFSCPRNMIVEENEPLLLTLLKNTSAWFTVAQHTSRTKDICIEFYLHDPPYRT